MTYNVQVFVFPPDVKRCWTGTYGKIIVKSHYCLLKSLITPACNISSNGLFFSLLENPHNGDAVCTLLIFTVAQPIANVRFFSANFLN